MSRIRGSPSDSVVDATGAAGPEADHEGRLSLRTRTGVKRSVGEPARSDQVPHQAEQDLLW